MRAVAERSSVPVTVCPPAGKPVAMMTTSTSSDIFSSIHAPKMTLAEKSITPFTRSAAIHTSSKERSFPPTTLRMTELAPSIVVLSKGLHTAQRTASEILFSPLATPIPI